MTKIDHLVFAAPDLTGGVADIEERLGARPAPGGHHPQWGTRNALLSLGAHTYFEVIGPDPGRSGEALPTAFGINRVTQPRLVTWAAQCKDLDGTVQRAAQRDIHLGAVIAGGRQTPEGQRLSWRFTDPLVVLGDGLIPFLIDWGDTKTPARTAPPGGELVHLRAEHPQPQRILDTLSVLGIELPVQLGKHPRLIATIKTPAGEVEVW